MFIITRLIVLFIAINILPAFGYAQYRFSASSLPKTIEGGGTNYSTCASPGTNSISFTVGPSLPTTTSTFTLGAIDLTFDAASPCGTNFNALGLWIKSPDGKCMKVYDGGLSTTGYDVAGSGRYVSLSLRDGSCLNDVDIKANSNWDPVASASGNFGVFKPNGGTSLGTQTMAQYFNGINPNGTWTMYAFQSTGTQPCISAASLLFTKPDVADSTSKGDDCSTAIEWKGQPFCLQTNGKTSSSQMPGWIGSPCSAGFAVTIGNPGTVCDWNNANNNDVWIKFTATSGGTMCLGISGLDQLQQSIIVSDANRDGDNNPCTQFAKNTTTCNDPNWVVASCSRSGIYTTTSGSSYNQQHCFLSESNKTYYLVIDGNGGAETPFYLSGFSGPLPAILPIDENRGSINIRAMNGSKISMSGTLLQTNTGNKKYLQHINIYDGLGRLHYQTKKWVSGYSELNINRVMISGLNVIRVHLEDEVYSTYTFKISKQ